MTIKINYWNIYGQYCCTILVYITMSLSVIKEASSSQLPQCKGSLETASSKTENASFLRFNFFKTIPYLQQMKLSELGENGGK